MLCRHTLPFLLLALSSSLGLGAHSNPRAHPYPQGHSRQPKTRHNNFLQEVTNSSVQFAPPGSSRDMCPGGGRGPPSLTELRTTLDYHPFLELTPQKELMCLAAPHEPCLTPEDPCAPEGLCSPAGSDTRLRHSRLLRLKNCHHLTLFSVMSPMDRQVLEDATSCCSLARHLKERDAIVRSFLDVQEVLLRRSSFNNDCKLGGSTRDSSVCGGNPHLGCVTCEEAYRRWLCSRLFPFYDGEGCLVRPCPSVCHCVEQKCPYFLPQDKPVAGEPSFLCEESTVGITERLMLQRKEGAKRCYEPCAPTESLGGRLHEKTNMSEFAICIQEGTRSGACSASSGGPGLQCLLRCGVFIGWWPILILAELWRTLFLRPWEFT